MAHPLVLDIDAEAPDESVLHFSGTAPTARLSIRNSTTQLHGFVISPREGKNANAVVYSPRSGLVQPNTAVEIAVSLAGIVAAACEATHVVLWRRVAPVEARRITSPAEYFERREEGMLELARGGRGTRLVPLLDQGPSTLGAFPPLPPPPPPEASVTSDLAEALAQSVLDAGGPTFARSRFKEVYSRTPAVQYPHEILGAVHGVVQAYAGKHGISEAEVHDFFSRVQSNAVRAGGLDEVLNDVQYVAVRMWTTAEQLCGRELCGLINEALREDSAVEHTAVFCRALNAFCVKRRADGGVSQIVRWPDSNEVVRGGGLPARHRAFFTVGKKYRVPMYLATSF